VIGAGHVDAFVQANVIVTSVLFHPFTLGGGDTEMVIVGGVSWVVCGIISIAAKFQGALDGERSVS
jgi:type IV secretory pathway TrbD component